MSSFFDSDDEENLPVAPPTSPNVESSQPPPPPVPLAEPPAVQPPPAACALCANEITAKQERLMRGSCEHHLHAECAERLRATGRYMCHRCVKAENETKHTVASMCDVEARVKALAQLRYRSEKVRAHVFDHWMKTGAKKEKRRRVDV